MVYYYTYGKHFPNENYEMHLSQKRNVLTDHNVLELDVCIEVSIKGLNICNIIITMTS